MRSRPCCKTSSPALTTSKDRGSAGKCAAVHSYPQADQSRAQTSRQRTPDSSTGGSRLHKPMHRHQTTHDLATNGRSLRSTRTIPNHQTIPANRIRAIKRRHISSSLNRVQAHRHRWQIWQIIDANESRARNLSRKPSPVSGDAHHDGDEYESRQHQVHFAHNHPLSCPNRVSKAGLSGGNEGNLSR